MTGPHPRNKDPPPASTTCLAKGPYFPTCTKSVAEAAVRVYKGMVAEHAEFGYLSLPVLQRVFGFLDCKLVKNSSLQEETVACRNSHDQVVAKLKEHLEREEALQNAFAGHAQQLGGREAGRALASQVDYTLSASQAADRATAAVGANAARSMLSQEVALEMGEIAD